MGQSERQKTCCHCTFSHIAGFLLMLLEFPPKLFIGGSRDSELIETWLKRSQLICRFECQRWTSAEPAERLNTQIPPQSKSRLFFWINQDHGLWWVPWIWPCLHRVPYQLSERHTWEVCVWTFILGAMPLNSVFLPTGMSCPARLHMRWSISCPRRFPSSPIIGARSSRIWRTSSCRVWPTGNRPTSMPSIRHPRRRAPSSVSCWSRASESLDSVG